MKVTYLELSEENGVSHKFYEVTVNGCEMTIRYGRIGQSGQSSTKVCSTPEQAEAEAQKKLNEKRKKGYAEAVQGARAPRPITRRVIVSNQSTSKTAPVLWKFRSGSAAFGIFVDERSCWLGNEQGNVYRLNHEGVVTQQFRFTEGVKAIVSDGLWLYAGCDDGKVYDLTGKIPRIAYDIEKQVSILWIDIYDGILGISDGEGNVFVNDYEGEEISTYKSAGNTGWMIRCDENTVYHGHSQGVTAYHNSFRHTLNTMLTEPSSMVGTAIWHCKTRGAVLFGWQEKSMLYAGTSDNKVYAIRKTGELDKVYPCDASIFSCATAKDGEYIFAGDNYSSIYCFNNAGERLWKLGTGCGSAYSMQYLNERLYIVTTEGVMACIDASPAAILQAKEGVFPEARSIKAPPAVAPTNFNLLEEAKQNNTGVILHCVKMGSKLRIRVLSAGYHQDWNVQFPQNLRVEGRKYLVEGIQESGSSSFYRVLGEIKILKDDPL